MNSRRSPGWALLGFTTVLLYLLQGEALLAAPVTLVSKGTHTTELVGKKYPANAEVTVEVVDPVTGLPVNIGVVSTDNSGQFDVDWPNLLSTGAVVQPGMIFNFIVKGERIDSAGAIKDSSTTDWTLSKLFNFLSDVGPLTNQIHFTDLASAGFSGTVSLIATTPNIIIDSSSTAFDFPTDTITTVGFYDVPGLGPVFGTYEAVGTFTNLFDPTTGLPITGVQTLIGVEQIGVIVAPEPPGTALIVAGLGFLAVGRRYSRRFV